MNVPKNYFLTLTCHIYVKTKKFRHIYIGTQILTLKNDVAADKEHFT